MAKIDYILRHGLRVFESRKCEVLRKENGKWEFCTLPDVVIAVDEPFHNQDPYVFNDNWVYAYCHINQLRIDIGNQSILIWGAWKSAKEQDKFLVDTVFIVDKKFAWDGNEPNKSFKKEFPYSKNDGIYENLFKYKIDKPNTDRIYTAKQFNNGSLIHPNKRQEEYYSFMPLVYKDGCYELIDILPIIKENDYEFTTKMAQRNQGGVRNIDFAYKAVNYLYENANILVTKVLEDEPFKNINEDLQKKYFPLNYGIEYNNKSIKRCSKC